MTAETAAMVPACVISSWCVSLNRKLCIAALIMISLQPISSEPVAVSTLLLESTDCEGRAACWWPLMLCQVCCASLVRFCVNYRLMSVAFDRFSFQHV